jgi:hypothetical protein
MFIIQFDSTLIFNYIKDEYIKNINNKLKINNQNLKELSNLNYDLLNININKKNLEKINNLNFN